MEISGEYKFKAPIEKVWGILMNPNALKASLPGCEKFEETAPDTYDITIKVGVGMIKGTYTGRISIADRQEQKYYKLLVSGQGSSGFLNGEGEFNLSSLGPEETQVNYSGKANVGGTLAGLGARMLAPVAKKMGNDFFKSMDKQLQAETKSV
ncbi:MAG: hypothetical protein JWP00_2652 [Chloroflexi bacterium]|jgi:carbon monoxide dehydrogenase subunit G|nr:hypothetical protein [Chloroflexota bacterium]